MKTRRGSEKGIDWDLVRQRLAKAARVLEDQQAPSPERLRELLAERARALAAVPPPAPRTGPLLDAFEFELDGDCYAVDLQYVQEVHALKELTPLPGTPPFVRGIVNLHGCITAVVDLRSLLGLPEKGLGGLDRLVLLSGGGMRFCVLADRIIGAHALPLDTIRPLPAEGVYADFVIGMTAGRLTVLDGEKLLSDKMAGIV